MATFSKFLAPISMLQARGAKEWSLGTLGAVHAPFHHGLSSEMVPHGFSLHQTPQDCFTYQNKRIEVRMSPYFLKN